MFIDVTGAVLVAVALYCAGLGIAFLLHKFLAWMFRA